MIVSIGRDIIYTDDSKNFAQKVKQRAQYYVDEMSNLMKTTWNYY